jgi:hypothetical protein
MSKQTREISTLLLLILISIFDIQLSFAQDKKGENKKSNPKKISNSAIKSERAILDADGDSPSSQVKKEPNEGERKPKQYKGKYSDDLLVSTDSKNDKSDRELRVLVEGLNRLLKIEKPSVKRNELFLSKGAAYLNLAKYYRIKAKTPGQYRKFEEENLNNALTIAKVVEKSEFADAKQKARALHLSGTSYVFLHNDDASIVDFTKALDIDKTAPVNPRLSIYIAEHLYDKEKYFEALPRYSQYFANLTNEEKALAIYKSGWCFILTKQYSNAEKTFLKIIGKKWAGDFGTDSIRDLAYTVTSHLNEEEIIEFGRTHFGDNNKAFLVDFYTEAYQVLIRESANIDRVKLYNEIITLDSRPERKVVVSLKRLSTHQRDFASEIPYSELMEIQKMLFEFKLMPDSEGFKYFSSELENELKKIIKAYADTVSKKVKTTEKMTDLELSQQLSAALKMHIEFYPGSPNMPQSYILGLDNCTFIKDYECNLRLSREILKMEALKSIWGRAQIQMVIALEMLSNRDAKYKDEYFTQLFGLVEKQENTPQWLTLAKKLTVYYVESKKFEEAYPYLEKIYKKEPNAENLYRKLYCAFELKNYKEITTHTKLLPQKGAPFYSELATIFRESNIKLAQDSAKVDEFEKYETHLNEFLKLNPDEAKADIARADYFRRLLDKEQYDKLYSGLDALPAAKKYNEPFKKITQNLLMVLFKNGKSREVLKFLTKDSKLGMFAEFNSIWFRALWAGQTLLTKKDHEILSQVGAKDRAAVLGLLTLSKPEAVIQYYTDYPPKTDNDKKVLLLNLQIKEGSKEAMLLPKYFDMVQSILPPELLNTKITPSEKLVGYVEFPELKWNEKRLAKVMPDAVSRIRTIRAQVLRDVVGKGYPVQKRILTTALTSESRMVDFFKAAPIPTGLSPENENAYREEINSIMTEFADQAAEYQKMIGNLDEKMAEIKKNEIGIPANLDDWTKPVGEITRLVEAELLQKNGFAALVILESQRAFEKISDEDYYSLRAFAVLKTLPNSVSAKYIQDELATAKQLKLIEKWKELAGEEAGKRKVAGEKAVNTTVEKRKVKKEDINVD